MCHRYTFIILVAFFGLRVIKISDYGGKEHEKKDSKSTGVRNDSNGIDE